MSMSTCVYSTGAVLAEGGRPNAWVRLGEPGRHKTDILLTFGFFVGGTGG